MEGEIHDEVDDIYTTRIGVGGGWGLKPKGSEGGEAKYAAHGHVLAALRSKFWKVAIGKHNDRERVALHKVESDGSNIFDLVEKTSKHRKNQKEKY